MQTHYLTTSSRSHNCGELRPQHIGKDVQVCGWIAKRRNHGGLLFLDLRDRYGLIQIVFDPAIFLKDSRRLEELQGELEKLRTEFVVWISGTVRERPVGMQNTSISTGFIEILLKKFKTLSEAKTPPFLIEDTIDASESIRLKYRYLDLRRPILQKNLILRHKLLVSARDFLNKNFFIEVETPILYKSTPEGARDFIVPSRLNSGKFYALPQSPQMLKQLLMVAGLDRYYQLARCFRDEDLRADRQPEFSQIDIETSFLGEEEIFQLMEQMVCQIWRDILGEELKIPFLRLPYQTAIDRYGSDKPDIRFGLEIEDFSEIFKNSTFRVFKEALIIKGIIIRDCATHFSRKDINELEKELSILGAKGLLAIKVLEGGQLQSPVAKFFSETEKQALQTQFDLKVGDLLFFVSDPKPKIVWESLGALRLLLAEKLNLLKEAPKNAFLWITDFPLLEFNNEEGRFFACHHPFTAPKAEYFDDFLQGKNLENVQASAYDLVLNGVEIGGGSLRIYRPDIQNAMFRALSISPEAAVEKFGFFLEALQYGTPPHGGIAFGVERLVALLSGGGPIRDVMAFPKTQKGYCLMSESPNPVDSEQLFDLGISINPKSKSTTTDEGI